MSLQRDLAWGDRHAERQTELLERALLRAYTQALRTLRAELAEAYARWDMTYENMQKYGRLAALERELQKHIRELTGNQARTLRRGLGDIYADSYYSTAWAIERELQARLRYTLLDPKVIRAAVQMPLSGLTLNERLSVHRGEVERRIRQAVTQGLIRGDSYQDMARRMRDGLEIEANKAIRIARTEAHRVQNMGRLESLEHAQEQGVRMRKRWVAAIDDHTREAHEELDGVEVDMDEDFESSAGGSGPGPGMMGDPADDVNCRCTMIAVIAGYEPEVRRIRGEGVVPYRTFEEYKRERFAA